MEKNALREFLRREAGFWSRMGWHHDPPLLNAQGKIAACGEYAACRRFHQDFYRSGVRVHSSILFSGWADVGRIDYSETDRALENIFADKGDDFFYIPRVKLNVPVNWGRENPEEMTVYYPGFSDPAEIRKRVNTPEHDFCGWDEQENWMGRALGCVRANVGGLIGNQSFSSEKWLHDAGGVLAAFVRHLETSPYGRRILGYHIAYGMCGETSLWRCWSPNGRYADYGIAHRRRFFDWGVRKYGSAEALGKAWLQPGATADTLVLPSPDEREYVWTSIDDFFRGSPRARIVIDLELFMNDVNCDAMEHFCRIVKEQSGGKAAGVFFGYYMDVPRVGYTGHVPYDRILESPWIDFIASPKSYARTMPGEPGGEHVPAQSVNRKKLYLNEIDHRTHLVRSGNPAAGEKTRDMNETRTLLWREAMKNTMRNSGYWWMDLGGGWLDSPEILSEIRRIESFRHQLMEQEARPVAEVLMVTDDRSFLYARPHGDLHCALFKNTPAEILLCGAPVDHYRFRDLFELDLSRYKCIFFLNAFLFSAEEWASLSARIAPDACLVWHYAPGIFSPEYDPDAVHEKCGFFLKRPAESLARTSLIPDGGFRDCPVLRREDAGNAYPYFILREDASLRILGRLDNGDAVIGETRHGGRRNLYISLPLCTWPYYRRIMEESGVLFYAPPETTVYADSRFIGLFPRKDVRFPPPFPYGREIVFGGECSGTLRIEGKGVRVFLPGA